MGLETKQSGYQENSNKNNYMGIETVWISGNQE